MANDPNEKLSAHFTLREMTRSDYAARNNLKNDPTDVQKAALKLLCERVLEPIRAKFGKPVRVSSGFRAPAVNKGVGGSTTGSHPRGEAADIEVDDVDNIVLAHWIRDNLDFDQVISEYYVPGDPKSGWVHVSFKATGNRKQALTITKGKTTGGLPPLPH